MHNNMKQFILLVFFNAIAFLGYGQDNHPVSWEFRVEKTGSLTYRVDFVATIKAPYHIYPQTSGGMGMPTEFLFEDNQNIGFIGEVEEKGIGAKDGEELPYYKKGAIFSQVLKLKSDNQTELKFAIKYMACNDQMCLPPSKKNYTLSINGTNSSAAEHNRTSARLNDSNSKWIYDDFVMSDTMGKKISSKEITAKSKYTFIDFWASWCVPCRAQGLALIPLYNKYQSRGFDVIAVSLDTNPTAWKKAIETDHYTWTNVSDLKGFESEIAKKYHITAIPRNFLVDNKGNIVAGDLHGKELEAKLAELFN